MLPRPSELAYHQGSERSGRTKTPVPEGLLSGFLPAGGAAFAGTHALGSVGVEYWFLLHERLLPNRLTPSPSGYRTAIA